MEWLEYAMWPCAAVVIVTVFFLIFRSAIAQLLGRVTKVGKKGIEAAPEQSPPEAQSASEAARELNRMLDNPAIAHRVKELHDDPMTKQLGVGRDAVDTLIRHLAVAQASTFYEQVDSAIWGTQLELLHRLNSAQAGLSSEEVRQLYDRFLALQPKGYTPAPSDAWLGFLSSSQLIAEQGGRSFITDYGRGYLLYITAMGRPHARML